MTVETNPPSRRQIFEGVGDVSRAIGQLEGRFEQHDARLERMEQTLAAGIADLKKTMNGKIESHDARLDEHDALINQGKGVAKMVQWFGGIGGVSGLAAAAWTWVKTQGS